MLGIYTYTISSSENIFTTATAVASLFAGTVVDPKIVNMRELSTYQRQQRGEIEYILHTNDIGQLEQGPRTCMPNRGESHTLTCPRPQYVFYGQGT